MTVIGHLLILYHIVLCIYFYNLTLVVTLFIYSNIKHKHKMTLIQH
jgi:hypothetical protein